MELDVKANNAKFTLRLTRIVASVKRLFYILPHSCFSFLLFSL